MDEAHPTGAPGNDDDEFLTEEEAAAILKMKPQTLSNWRCTRRYPLPFYKVGRAVRYKRSEVRRFAQRASTS